MKPFIGFCNRYHAELREEIEAVEIALTHGNVPDFTEYKRLVGKRSGLLQALERHQELLTMMEQANEK